MNELKDPSIAALAAVQGPKLPNHDYSAMPGRDLSSWLSHYLSVKREAQTNLVDLESRASEMRENDEPILVGELLGSERTRFIHAVRQIVTIGQEQKKRRGVTRFLKSKRGGRR